MFCGDYVDASTPVYIDHNIFNYTEANKVLKRLDDEKLFGILTRCRWVSLNMSCLSIYPRCNITTQALLPPCEDDCLEYAKTCKHVHLYEILYHAALFTDNPLHYTRLILNCSSPFKAFGSLTNVDKDKCYNFSCKLIFMVICCI